MAYDAVIDPEILRDLLSVVNVANDEAVIKLDEINGLHTRVSDPANTLTVDLQILPKAFFDWDPPEVEVVVDIDKWIKRLEEHTKEAYEDRVNIKFDLGYRQLEYHSALDGGLAQQQALLDAEGMTFPDLKPVESNIRLGMDRDTLYDFLKAQDNDTDIAFVAYPEGFAGSGEAGFILIAYEKWTHEKQDYITHKDFSAWDLHVPPRPPGVDVEGEDRSLFVSNFAIDHLSGVVRQLDEADELEMSFEEERGPYKMEAYPYDHTQVEVRQAPRDVDEERIDAVKEDVPFIVGGGASQYMDFTIKGKLLYEVSMLRQMADEWIGVVDDDGVVFHHFCPANVAVIRAELPPDAFEQFHTDELDTPFRFEFDANDLWEKVKADKSKLFQFGFDPEEEKMFVNPGMGETYREVDVDIVDEEYFEDKRGSVPDIEHTVKMTHTDGTRLKKDLTQAFKIGEDVAFYSSQEEKELRLYPGDGRDEPAPSEFVYTLEELDNFRWLADVDWVYEVYGDWLWAIRKRMKGGVPVDLHFAPRTPLRVRYTIEDDLTLDTLIAPKVDLDWQVVHATLGDYLDMSEDEVKDVVQREEEQRKEETEEEPEEEPEPEIDTEEVSQTDIETDKLVERLDTPELIEEDIHVDRDLVKNFTKYKVRDAEEGDLFDVHIYFDEDSMITGVDIKHEEAEEFKDITPYEEGDVYDILEDMKDYIRTYLEKEEESEEEVIPEEAEGQIDIDDLTNDETLDLFEDVASHTYQGDEQIGHPSRVVQEFLSSDISREKELSFDDFTQDHLRGFKDPDPQVANYFLWWVSHFHPIIWEEAMEEIEEESLTEIETHMDTFKDRVKYDWEIENYKLVDDKVELYGPLGDLETTLSPTGVDSEYFEEEKEYIINNFEPLEGENLKWDDFNGRTIKKLDIVDKARQRYHNTHVDDSGNFGYTIYDDEDNSFTMDGEYNTEKVITDLRIKEYGMGGVGTQLADDVDDVDDLLGLIETAIEAYQQEEKEEKKEVSLDSWMNIYKLDPDYERVFQPNFYAWLDDQGWEENEDYALEKRWRIATYVPLDKEIQDRFHLLMSKSRMEPFIELFTLADDINLEEEEVAETIQDMDERGLKDFRSQKLRNLLEEKGVNPSTELLDRELEHLVEEAEEMEVEKGYDLPEEHYGWELTSWGDENNHKYMAEHPRDIEEDCPEVELYITNRTYDTKGSPLHEDVINPEGNYVVVAFGCNKEYDIFTPEDLFGRHGGIERYSETEQLQRAIEKAKEYMEDHPSYDYWSEHIRGEEEEEEIEGVDLGEGDKIRVLTEDRRYGTGMIYDVKESGDRKRYEVNFPAMGGIHDEQMTVSIWSDDEELEVVERSDDPESDLGDFIQNWDEYKDRYEEEMRSWAEQRMRVKYDMPVFPTGSFPDEDRQALQDMFGVWLKRADREEIEEVLEDEYNLSKDRLLSPNIASDPQGYYSILRREASKGVGLKTHWFEPLIKEYFARYYEPEVIEEEEVEEPEEDEVEEDQVFEMEVDFNKAVTTDYIRSQIVGKYSAFVKGYKDAMESMVERRWIPPERKVRSSDPKDEREEAKGINEAREDFASMWEEYLSEIEDNYPHAFGYQLRVCGDPRREESLSRKLEAAKNWAQSLDKLAEEYDSLEAIDEDTEDYYIEKEAEMMEKEDWNYLYVSEEPPIDGQLESDLKDKGWEPKEDFEVYNQSGKVGSAKPIPYEVFEDHDLKLSDSDVSPDINLEDIAERLDTSTEELAPVITAEPDNVSEEEAKSVVNRYVREKDLDNQMMVTDAYQALIKQGREILGGATPEAEPMEEVEEVEEEEEPAEEPAPVPSETGQEIKDNLKEALASIHQGMVDVTISINEKQRQIQLDPRIKDSHEDEFMEDLPLLTGSFDEQEELVEHFAEDFEDAKKLDPDMTDEEAKEVRSKYQDLVEFLEQVHVGKDDKEKQLRRELLTEIEGVAPDLVREYSFSLIMDQHMPDRIEVIFFIEKNPPEWYPEVRHQGHLVNERIKLTTDYSRPDKLEVKWRNLVEFLDLRNDEGDFTDKLEKLDELRAYDIKEKKVDLKEHLFTSNNIRSLVQIGLTSGEAISYVETIINDFIANLSYSTYAAQLIYLFDQGDTYAQIKVEEYLSEKAPSVVSKAWYTVKAYETWENKDEFDPTEFAWGWFKVHIPEKGTELTVDELKSLRETDSQGAPLPPREMRDEGVKAPPSKFDVGDIAIYEIAGEGMKVEITDKDYLPRKGVHIYDFHMADDEYETRSEIRERSLEKPEEYEGELEEEEKKVEEKEKPAEEPEAEEIEGVDLEESYQEGYDDAMAYLKDDVPISKQEIGPDLKGTKRAYNEGWNDALTDYHAEEDRPEEPEEYHEGYDEAQELLEKDIPLKKKEIKEAIDEDERQHRRGWNEAVEDYEVGPEPEVVEEEPEEEPETEEEEEGLDWEEWEEFVDETDLKTYEKVEDHPKYITSPIYILYNDEGEEVTHHTPHDYLFEKKAQWIEENLKVVEEEPEPEEEEEPEEGWPIGKKVEYMAKEWRIIDKDVPEFLDQVRYDIEEIDNPENTREDIRQKSLEEI